MASERTASELSPDHRWLQEDIDGTRSALGLALCWSLTEPGRIGEVATVPEGAQRLLGRGDEATLRFVRARPSGSRPGGPLEGRLLSRRQLEVHADGEALRLTNVGACGLSIDGVGTNAGVARVGAVIALDRQLVLLVVRRGPLPDGIDDGPFGGPDADGIVGESEAAWELRARLGFVGRSTEPVLVCGESGTGKELAAAAIHRRSARAAGPFVARNAATLPEGLVDAELFGNARNYPNPGLPERPGLIGAADGGTLFLDELGEMPVALQAHLLRVLDRGDYQRLGEARARRADLRFVAATNRDPSALKHDLLARLPLRVELPGLSDRPEDVPLLVRHLLAEARTDPALGARFFDGADARIAPELIAALLRHRWTHHVRELRAIVWRSLETSPGRALVVTPAVQELLSPASPGPSPTDLDAAAVRAALDAAGGNVTDAARALGLSSRFALYRVLRKLGIDARDR
ncbi:MAG: sigma 54-interacting transcriptional regulator [Myxococcota bacterium]